MALSDGKTSSMVIDWVTLVAEVEGDEYPFFEHDAYEFSRKLFRETDHDGHYNDTKPN